MSAAKIVAVVLGLSALWGLAGCKSARRGEPIVGPLPISGPGLERGRIAFMRHCHMCHPGGEAGLGPALNDKPAPAFLIKTQVRVGLGTMPAFDERRIPPEELDEIIQFMLALRRHKEPLPGRL